MLAQRRFELVSDAWQRIPEDGVDEKEARAYLVGHRGPDGARPLREPERGDLAAELSRLPLALAQDADALPFLGEIHEVEVDGEGRGGGPGRIRRERGHLGGEIAWGRRRARTTRLGQGADPLFGLEEGDRLPRPEHIAKRLTEQVDGRRKVHDRSGDV